MSVIEIQTFRLAQGADETDFLGADQRVQTEFFPFQPGAMRRTTAREPEGGWIVVVLWGSERDADGAADSSADHPATKAFAALQDPSTLRVRRYVTLD